MLPISMVSSCALWLYGGVIVCSVVRGCLGIHCPRLHCLDLPLPSTMLRRARTVCRVSHRGCGASVGAPCCAQPVSGCAVRRTARRRAGGVGSVGLISNARSFLWIPISQDAERRISLEAFEHMLNLDLSFHLARKTGALSPLALAAFTAQI